MTAADWPIIKQIAQVLGLIMRLLYNITSVFGIHNLALCIFLFTIITKIVLIPSSYRTQKKAILAPQLSDVSAKIHKRYSDKSQFPIAMTKLGIEKSFVLDKYNIVSANGCLSVILQIPVLIALYAVVQDVPRFVPEVSLLSETQLASAYNVFGISISGKPMWSNITIIFPIVCALLQFVEMFITSSKNSVVSTKKTVIVNAVTNLFTALMTFYFSISLPIVCSFYWCARSIASIIIVIAIRHFVSHKGLEYFGIKRLKKKNKSRVKRHLPELKWIGDTV